MNLFKALFGGKEEKPEERKKAEEEKNFDVLKYDGVRALRSNQHAYAIKCFTHALKMKDDLEVIDYLSQALIRADRLPEAYGQLLKLAEAQPDNQYVMIRMANVAYMMEDYDAMADACGKALIIDDNNAEVNYLYAKAYIGHGDTANAIAMLTKAVTVKPDYGEAYLLRGETLLGAGDTAKAEEDAERLLTDYPENEEVMMLKARIENKKGNHEEAIHYYNIVIEANPFNADAYRERGEQRIAAGEAQGGQEDIAYADELKSKLDIGESNEDIEKKVKDAYKNIDPYGVF